MKTDKKPSGGARAGVSEAGLAAEALASCSPFVVQEQRARNHYLGLRAQVDRAFKRWGGQKLFHGNAAKIGPAHKSEGHDPYVCLFEGRIPDGNYGEGETRVSNHGVHGATEWSAGRICFRLSGARFIGHFEMLRLEHGNPGGGLLLNIYRAAESKA